MHRRRLEARLHDLIGRGEAGLDVADLELNPLGDVRGFARRGHDAARDHVLKQQWSIGLHRRIDVDDVRQHFIIDFDQPQRLLGDRLAGRGDGGDGVALVEDLLARHDVARHVPVIHGDTLGADILELLLGEVRGRDHRLDAWQRLRFRGIDRADTRMGVRRAQDLAPQHSRQREVSAVLGKTRHLRHAVGPHRAGADDFEFFFGVIDRGRHDQLPRISVAASSTASTIL